MDDSRPIRRWTFSLRALFAALTVFGVWLGVALSARDRADGIAFAVSSVSLTAALWLAEPAVRPQRTGWRLLGWSAIGIGSMAILCGLWPMGG
jgi:hypothetical protein